LLEEVVKVIKEENLLDNVKVTGNYLLSNLEQMQVGLKEINNLYNSKNIIKRVKCQVMYGLNKYLPDPFRYLAYSLMGVGNRM
jgi:hypothetical protein